MKKPLCLVPVVLLVFAAFPSFAVDLSTLSPDSQLSKPQPPVSRDVYYYSLGDRGPRVEGVISGPAVPHMQTEDYPLLPFLGRFGESRLIIWILAQQHLYWGGLVLGVLLMATLLEIHEAVWRKSVGTTKYDDLAFEMLNLVMLAFAVTAILGGFLLFGLLVLYPQFTAYLFGVFRPVVLLYGALVLAFVLGVYLYYYTWQAVKHGFSKWMHVSLGVLVNVFGTTLMLLGNAWGSFMMSPAGVDDQGRFLGNYWHVLHTALWNPLNIHRFAGNIVLGASVIAAYASYRALTEKTHHEKAYFDRMAYVAFLFVVFALFTIPFGGYWLSREIYAYRQQMGITMFGGLLAWLGIVLVTLVGTLFFGINYYLWQRISSLEHGVCYSRYAKYVFFVLALCLVVYISPHTMVMTPLELKMLGGQQHQVLGNYGVESAKSTAINLMIVVTLCSFALWSRCRFSSWTHNKYQNILLVSVFTIGPSIFFGWAFMATTFLPAFVLGYRSRW